MTIEEKFLEHVRAVLPGWEVEHAPPILQSMYAVNAHNPFLAGAAAMAELLAVNNQPLVEEMAKWRETFVAALPTILHRHQYGGVGSGGGGHV